MKATYNTDLGTNHKRETSSLLANHRCSKHEPYLKMFFSYMIENVPSP